MTSEAAVNMMLNHRILCGYGRRMLVKPGDLFLLCETRKLCLARMIHR